MNTTAPDTTPQTDSEIVAAAKAKLLRLRDEFVARDTGGRHQTAESQEWARLDVGHRMAMLLLAGIDGDLQELAQRDWREMPHPEQQAIRCEIRAAKKAFSGLMALAGRW